MLKGQSHLSDGSRGMTAFAEGWSAVGGPLTGEQSGPLKAHSLSWAVSGGGRRLEAHPPTPVLFPEP